MDKRQPDAGPRGHETDPVQRWIAERQKAYFLNRLAQPDGLKLIALEAFDAGRRLIGEAFNIEEDPAWPYGYSEKVRERVLELLFELFQIYKQSPMQTRSQNLTTLDPEFQRFLLRAQGQSGNQSS